jgi:hypothetical protein
MKDSSISRTGLLDFVLIDMTKAAGTWQTQPSTRKRGIEIPTTAVTPSRRLAQSGRLESAVSEILAQALTLLDAKQV